MEEYMTVHIDGHDYPNLLDGSAISFEDFYGKIRGGVLATTSAANVGQFQEAMRPILAAGKDIVSINFSSALSTTYAIIGMTITSLYNIIDSIFIGHGVGAMGIAGLAITFPLMNLVVAFCTLVSAGGSTISSIRLGQKDLDGATEVLGNTLMFCLINAVVFGGLAFLFLDEILRFFGASQDTLPYARDFMQIILAGTPITYTMIGLNNIMRATGYPKKAMLTSMVTVCCVCNRGCIDLAPSLSFDFY